VIVVAGQKIALGRGYALWVLTLKHQGTPSEEDQ
jgi:hypothetical protein